MLNKNFYTEIEATIQSINGMASAEMPPFFYTRLQAKIQAQQVPFWLQQLFVTPFKPVLGISTLLLFLALNIKAIKLVVTNKSETQQTVTSHTIQGFAQDYNIGTDNIYTDKPE